MTNSHQTYSIKWCFTVCAGLFSNNIRFNYSTPSELKDQVSVYKAESHARTAPFQ